MLLPRPSAWLTKAAKGLVRKASKSELRLMGALGQCRELGVWKFQEPWGHYVPDLISHQHRILVEVDGPHHAHQREKDAARDQFFLENGYRTLRIASLRVWKDLPGVLRQISRAVSVSLTSEPKTEPKRRKRAKKHKKQARAAWPTREITYPDIFRE